MAIYTVTMLVLLYPAPFRLRSAIVGLDRPTSDYYQYTWWLWWTKHAVLSPEISLDRITLINHPVGVHHPFTLTMAAVSLQALPFSLLFSPAATYNLQVLLSFVLAGIAMYWLVTVVTDCPPAGLVAGFIFAFFPNKTGHVLGGHLPQVTVHWFPLYALALWRALRKPSWRRSLLLSAALVPTCLTHVMHLPYLVLPVTLGVVALAWRESKKLLHDRRRLGVLLVGFVLAGLAVSPFLLPTVIESLRGADYLSRPGVVKSSTDLMAFIAPSPYHPLFQALGNPRTYASRLFFDEEVLREGSAYLGVLAAGLATWGALRRRREVWPWAVVCVGSALLSLGPLLKVGGVVVRYGVDEYVGYVTMPYALLQKLPILAMGRTPGRLNETTMFALAVLAGYGVAELLAAFARRSLLSLSLLALVLVGIGCEYTTMWPFPSASAEIPAVMDAIARAPGDGATLHIPPERGVNHRSLYYQTATQKPVVGGRVHRVLPETVPWTQTLRGLALPDASSADIVPRPSASARATWLRVLDVDHVVVHRDALADDGPQIREYVEALLGPPFQLGEVSSGFRVPDAISPLDDVRLYEVGEGWYAPELHEGVWRRWMAEEAQLYVYSLREELGGIRLTADSRVEPSVLDVYLGDERLDSILIDRRTVVTTRPFTLTSGMNVVRFVSRSGCTQLVDDPRCWSDATLSLDGESAQAMCDPEAIPTTCRSFVIDSVSFLPKARLDAGQGVTLAFGETMRMRGWRIEGRDVQPGGSLVLELSWEYTSDPSDRYVVFVHVLDDRGQLVAQLDEAPVGRRLDVAQWPARVAYTYAASILLPDDLRPGDYRVLVGVYEWPSLDRLPVAPGPGVPAAEVDAVCVGSIAVHE